MAEKSKPDDVSSAVKLLIDSSHDGLAPTEILNKIAQLIDLSHDLNCPEGTTVALDWCDTLEKTDLDERHLAYLDYFRANAWANRLREKPENSAWSWSQIEIQKQIYYLRKAITRVGFSTFDKILRCRIHTNLANQLNSVGRFVEAFEQWRIASTIHRKFGMAIGNLGSGMLHYGNANYDPGHRSLFMMSAHAELCRSLEPDAFFDAGDEPAIFSFSQKRDWIESLVDSKEKLKIDCEELKNHGLGECQCERDYREWCLNERLFLNPLNDLFTDPIAAQDILSQPNICTPVKNPSPPLIIGFFNQLKQEFASARWHFYEGINQSGNTHFSDKNVLLHDTLDYPSHSLAVEKVKMSFRAAYSILDKIGFIINDYFCLGVKENRVSFRGIWFSKPEKPIIRDEFSAYENWPLRGLFWLSKDLFEIEMQDVADPDSKALYEIRNHLEHKFLRVHEFGLSSGVRYGETEEGAISILRDDFEKKTLRLLKLCRAAIIYLSLGVESEERRRDNAGLSFPIHLSAWDDDWKH